MKTAGIRLVDKILKRAWRVGNTKYVRWCSWRPTHFLRLLVMVMINYDKWQYFFLCSHNWLFHSLKLTKCPFMYDEWQKYLFTVVLECQYLPNPWIRFLQKKFLSLKELVEMNRILGISFCYVLIKRWNLDPIPGETTSQSILFRHKWKEWSSTRVLLPSSIISK